MIQENGTVTIDDKRILISGFIVDGRGTHNFTEEVVEWAIQRLQAELVKREIKEMVEGE